MAEENFTEDTSDEQGILEEEKFDVVYECLRSVSYTHLTLPTILLV